MRLTRRGEVALAATLLAVLGWVLWSGFLA